MGTEVMVGATYTVASMAVLGEQPNIIDHRGGRTLTHDYLVDFEVSS